MSTKFMTWSLKRPTTSTFDEYKKLAPNEPWYSKNYITVNENAPEESNSWSAGSTGFVRSIEKNHEKIDAIGLHEFGISNNGDIFNMGYGQIPYPNGYYYNNPNMRVLNEAEDDIELPVPTSLRYLMHKYPNVRWALQFLATANSSGNRVTPLLNNERKPLFKAVYGNGQNTVFEPVTDKNGNIIYVNAQDEFIRQTKRITELYLEKGFPISDVEIDMEKTTTIDGEDKKFADLLARVKDEVCIPLGLELRVNLFAMTGEYNPAYYGWHNYSTIAAAKDKNGKQAVDEFQLMTYDFSWGGSAPGPSTPLWWLENVLEHVNNVLPPEKTYIGNAGYGRRWPLNEQRMGVTFDYKQLMQAQNGEYVHNDGSTSSDGNFYFANQDFIPLAGFNDKASDYQKTMIQVYDYFKAQFGELSGNIVRPSYGEDEDPYVTTYSTTQKPEFKGIIAEINSSTASGNVSTIGQGNHNGLNYLFKSSSKARWVYDEGQEICVKEPGEKGEDGSISFNFNLPKSGNFRLIALVSFPFYGSDRFDINVNGRTHKVGDNIPDWYPYITNPFWHFWDCGSYDLGTSNSINIGTTGGAGIAGFIICEDYEETVSGGQITYNSNLQKMKKRGPKKADGTSSIVDAKFPEKMTYTAENLRRPPRPAIIWEDMFGPHLKGDGFSDGTDLTSVGPYYQKANSSAFTNGSGETIHEVSGKKYCVSGVNPVGFSEGQWYVKDDESDAAHVWSNTKNNFGQLILNKLISGSIQVELDCRVSKSDTNARYGIRLINTKGNSSKGWIFRINFMTNQAEYYNLDDPSQNRYADLSSELSSGLGNRYTMRVKRIKGKIIFSVGARDYLSIDDVLPEEIAYGAYSTGASIKIYRLNISSLDRFEPMEKMNVYVDGNLVSEYGEVKRNVPYDEFGYLIYTGLPGNLTEAVRAIPSEAELADGTASQVEGRSGTIFETEITPENWSLDYKNIPIAKVDSKIGNSKITVEMKDPGIWLRSFYVGDSEGFSIAYNSDKIGFIRTSQMVLDYNCKGIAMWTLGQEDPSVFSYLLGN